MSSFRPGPSSLGVRRQMQLQRQKDTVPELKLRRALHARGFRFRVNYPPLAGLRRRADIAFTRQRVAVFVDGCFWHGCTRHKSIPKYNRDWWKKKIEANQRRDRDTEERLRKAGWSAIRVWEHEPVEKAVARVVHILKRVGDG